MDSKNRNIKAALMIVGAFVAGGGIIAGIELLSGEDKTPVTFEEPDFPKPPKPIVYKERSSSLEGKVAVQPSSISYVPITFKGYGMPTNFAFEYVMVRDMNNKIHTLIYPYSKGIAEGYAKIKYNIFNQGMIDADAFVHKFIGEGHACDDNLLEAEGYIIKDGIEYK